jgi:hypothetical protein
MDGYACAHHSGDGRYDDKAIWDLHFFLSFFLSFLLYSEISSSGPGAGRENVVGNCARAETRLWW